MKVINWKSTKVEERLPQLQNWENQSAKVQVLYKYRANRSTKEDMKLTYAI